MTTKVTGSVLANTAVTAGTYGGSTNIPVVTVDAQGRTTYAANVSLTTTSVYGNTGQITANTATGVVAVGLATSGAIAGSYGSGTTTPVISVDAYGRITSVSATTITGGSAGIGATTFNRQSNTATSGQTVFTVNGGYTVGYLQVYLNGVLLNASDYTASNGTSFTLATGATTGDIVESIAYTVSTVLNVGPSPSGGLAGQVLYQTAANTTGNTDVGTASSILTSAGSGKPYWSAQSSLVIANTQITGVMTASQLAATAVTPGTYGGATNIPVVVVDQQGRLTSAANVAFSSYTAPTVNVQTFNSTSTWTKPSGNYTTARVQIWGAGGGGSGGNVGNQLQVWGGGGGGAYWEIIIPISYLNSTVTATVGTGGSGASGGAAGGAGGSSSFTLNTAWNGLTTYTAGGGSGAAANPSGANAPRASGGLQQSASYIPYYDYVDSGFTAVATSSAFGGGLGGGGDSCNFWGGGSSYWGGGGGGLGYYTGTAQSLAGGSSRFGGAGGAGSTGAGTGNSGTAPGGGGGGRYAGTGGSGAAGRIIVTCW